MQLVLSGDFFQLPPVPEQSFNRKVPATYAFNAESWGRCISRPIFLRKVFRQKEDGKHWQSSSSTFLQRSLTLDTAFVRILSNMRRGHVTPEDVERLKALSRKIIYPDGIEPSEL